MQWLLGIGFHSPLRRFITLQNISSLAYTRSATKKVEEKRQRKRERPSVVDENICIFTLRFKSFSEPLASCPGCTPPCAQCSLG
ncbi:hypothetical protein AMELA_G00095600 [Ameiurus melas]|uniref:Uncharacterized protein n=1 Tax=Ameiurus melas TaxID=219545 RepID=A0A7J6ARU3_AMEME|nr:hypothetical protein AMELA_G00095600 [Ameiurus melas]